MIDHWILNEAGEPVLADLMTWATWFENGANRRVAMTDLGDAGKVSTVFLGLDHNFSGVENPLDYRPVLWETMIFGGPNDQEMWRYCSREEALKGHDAAVRLCKEKSSK